MKIVCAWCLQVIYVKELDQPHPDSHGICEACIISYMPAAIVEEYLKRKEVTKP